MKTICDLLAVLIQMIAFILICALCTPYGWIGLMILGIIIRG